MDAAGNAEFLLQKIGLSEDAAKFLGSSRGIDFMVAVSLLALIVSLLYQVHRLPFQREGVVDTSPAADAPLAFTERSLSAPEYTYSKDWLQNIAERDKRQIDWAARAIEFHLEWDLGADDSPCLRFMVTVFNGSVYTVSINKVEGFILYGKRRLEKEITLSTKWKVENLTPRYNARVEIFQWLTPEEAAIFRKDWDEQIFNTGFSFENLRIIVSGGDDFKDVVVPKPLSLYEYERMTLRRR